ncbi:MAG: hypothetical protein QOH29_3037 [Actinomycetota bacterium]|jgi:hypothetical protein|nr:hypothetical protein [Actinomycetota bacterium]
MGRVNSELWADVVLVALGMLAMATAITLVAKRNPVSVALVDYYLAVARRAPRWLPLPLNSVKSTRGFIVMVRIIAGSAHAGAVVFSMAGAALVVVGVDILE